MDKYFKKAIEYGVYVLIFLLPWQTRWIFAQVFLEDVYIEYWSKSLYVFDIVLVLVLVLASVFFFRSRDYFKIPNHRTWFFLALFEFFIFVSIFVSSDISLSLYRYLVFLGGVLLFALLLTFNLNKTMIAFSFFSSLFIQAAIAAGQFINQYSPANKYLGMAEQNPANLGVSVVEAMGSIGYIERWLRAYGSLEHPNILGAFLAIGCLIALMYLVKKSKENYLEGKKESREKIFRLNMNFFLLILIMTSGIFVSFSRAAWLSFALALSLYLFIQIIKKDVLSQKYFAPILFYMVFLIFLANIPYSNIIESRITSSGRLDIISNQERIESSITSKNIIEDNFLFGTGIANYTLSLKEEYSDINVYKIQAVHNTYLLILAETGIFSFISFLLFIFFYYKEVLQNIEILYKLPFILIILTLMLFDHWWFSLHFGLIYFFMILGLFYQLFSVDLQEENML